LIAETISWVKIRNNKDFLFLHINWAKYYFDELGNEYISHILFFLLFSCSFVMTQKNHLSAAIS